MIIYRVNSQIKKWLKFNVIGKFVGKEKTRGELKMSQHLFMPQLKIVATVFIFLVLAANAEQLFHASYIAKAI